jgi:glycosyltransferase involved in cell wall biosynthesis
MTAATYKDAPPRLECGTRQSLIVVAVLTYQRPKLLGRLLDEFSRSNLPVRFGTVLLVIDNDGAGSGQPIVDAWRTKIPNLRYLVETRRGIPVARNRAIDAAEELGADALCFLDDDEFPDKDWLVRIVEHWQDTGADLIGGPVFVAPTEVGKSPWQRAINRSLAARATKKNRDIVSDVEHGKRYTIVTNNWLCDLNWLKRVGLRFDERRLVSGGSDTVFFHAAQGLGCATSWCPRAMVYETMTDDRLSLRYHFARASSQSINHFQMKGQHITGTVVVQIVLCAAVRAVLGLGLLVIPIFGIASPLIAVRSLGWAVGRLRALQGKQSTLYA